MSLVLVTAPAVEPITLAEAKLHLRVDHDDEDDLITALIVAARRQAETFTRRALVEQTWRLTLDAFPAAPIRLPMGRVSTISHVKYVDGAGAWQTWAADNYLADLDSVPARIVPAYGQSWPSARRQLASVEIRFVAGFGNAAAVPADIKAAIKLALGDLYEERSAKSGGSPNLSPVPASLLWPYRIVEF